MTDMSIDVDDFALAVGNIMQEAVTEVDKASIKAIKASCVYCKNAIPGCIAQAGIKGDKYVNSFHYKVSPKSGTTTYGEVGSRDYPGLVHLLEKGHLTIGGNRVAARPHIKPAADNAFKFYEAEIDRDVGEALGQ